MTRWACLLLGAGLMVPAVRGEIHRHKHTFVDKTAHAAETAGSGIKGGAEKTGEAVSGAARATAHGAASAGRGVAHGARSVTHLGKSTEKTGGEIASNGH